MKRRWFPKGHTPSNGRRVKLSKKRGIFIHTNNKSNCRNFKKEFTVYVNMTNIIDEKEISILWDKLSSRILSNPNKSLEELIEDQNWLTTGPHNTSI